MKSKYQLKLHKSYYEKGFFNLGVDVERYLTYEEGIIDILVGKGEQKIEGRITRKANQNGTPRIYGRSELRDWFQDNYKKGEKVQVVILDPKRVWIK